MIVTRYIPGPAVFTEILRIAQEQIRAGLAKSKIRFNTAKRTIEGEEDYVRELNEAAKESLKRYGKGPW